MQTEDIQKYCDLMEEVKLRVRAVDFLLSGKGNALYEATTIESTGLQFRKILELIAFGSLMSNKTQYKAVYDNFSNAWNAELLLRDLERINPRFYPEPVIEAPSQEPGVKANLEPKKSGFLTKKEFVRVYKKCGGLMHASNPNGSKLDYNYYKSKFPIWRGWIIGLLNTHQIHLVDQDGFHLVHMEEAQDGKVHHYTFEPRP